MPSVRSLSGYALSALGSAQVALGMQSPVARDLFSRASASCSNPQLSCHNTTAVQDLCCFNSPGGALLQTQFWDTNPQTGPVDSWTIHGLWPDNCDGTYQANCDDSRAYTNITQILQAAGQDDLLAYMKTYWPDYMGNDESFWEHEWGKHGTCISTLDPDCYTDYKPTEEVPDFFNKVVELFKTLPTYKWLNDAGITPSTTKTYALADIQAALTKQHGHSVYIGCASGALDEVWYFYNVQGSLQHGNFVPTDLVGGQGKCPSTGIKYLPKTAGGSNPSPTTKPTTTQPTAQPTNTGPPFTGSGFLNVIEDDGTQNGCLISKGTWYTSGTCATYNAAASGNGYTLTSSKGKCGIVNDAFTCGSGVTATVFQTGCNNSAVGKQVCTTNKNGGTSCHSRATSTASSEDCDIVAYNGSENFYVDKEASGQDQETVYASSSHPTKIQLQWGGKPTSNAARKLL